jgi:electron transfer flavoprotein beta subunit
VNIIVLIAGVHDPKWPITPDSEANGLPAASHQVPSPFDEAAIEIALRIREARPDTLITAHVAGGAAGEKIARTIAALNITDVSTVELAAPWDQAATARSLAALCGDADLILIGREFGDYDDGMVPALLAGFLDIPLFARVQTIETQGDIRFTREMDSYVETLKVSSRLLASVTNDRRTRLRKPLMKNVMLARQASIGETVTQSASSSAIGIENMAPRNVDRHQTRCAMISGPPEVQARTLATILWEAR